MVVLNVPHIQLNDGNVIPQLGIGTYKLQGEDAYRITQAGLEMGYRHIDTAKLYDNEKEIGRALSDSGVNRDDVYLTTKVWPTDFSAVQASVEGSLRRLGTERVDLVLLHWPVPTLGTAWQAWEQLIRVRELGLAASIGVSNFEVPHLERIIKNTGVVPAVNQIELHPEHQRRELVAFCQKEGIARESWGPIARGRTDLFARSAVGDAAEAHGVSPAQVVLRWHLQHGTIIFPKTSRVERLRQNADIFGFTLSPQQMSEIDALEAGVRLGGDPFTYEG